jgi:hypothetical protein
MSEPEPEPGREEPVDVESGVETPGVVEEEPDHESGQPDPLAALERSVLFKARLFTFVCTLCAMISLVLLMVGRWPLAG